MIFKIKLLFFLGGNLIPKTNLTHLKAHSDVCKLNIFVVDN